MSSANAQLLSAGIVSAWHASILITVIVTVCSAMIFGGYTGRKHGFSLILESLLPTTTQLGTLLGSSGQTGLLVMAPHLV